MNPAKSWMKPAGVNQYQTQFQNRSEIQQFSFPRGRISVRPEIKSRALFYT